MAYDEMNRRWIGLRFARIAIHCNAYLIGNNNTEVWGHEDFRN